MAGLLDGGNASDPLALGLLGFGSALMTPRAMGGGMGPAFNAFSGGLLQGEQMKRARDQDARRNMLTDAQIKNFESDAEYRRGLISAKQAEAQREAALSAQKAQRFAEVEQWITQNKPELLPAFKIKPEEVISRLLPAQPKFSDVSAKDYTPESVAKFAQSGNHAELVPVRKLDNVGGVARNMYNIPENTPINDPNSLMHTGPGGQIVTNNPLLAAKKDIARSGASNIGMPRIDIKTGDSLAGQIGPMLKDSSIATQGAVKMVDAAERVIGAIDKGGVIAGPGASLRLKGAQIASLFGIGGKDAVAQTRQVIRGLAESSVEARKELQGQGQVTENEAKAVDKAMSGNIDDLTVEEIRDIARLNIRAGVARARQHQQYMSGVPESAANITPFYRVPAADRLLNMNPSSYEMPKPTGANVSPDGRTASGTIGGGQAQRVMRFDKNGNPVN